MSRSNQTLVLLGTVVLLAPVVLAQEGPSLGHFTPRAMLWTMGVPNQAPGTSWARFAVGSWAKTGGGPLTAIGQMKRTLKSKTDEEVVILMEVELSKEQLEDLEKLTGKPASEAAPKPMEETLSLKPGTPQEDMKLRRTYKDNLTVSGKSFACTVYEFEGAEGGKGEIWTSDDMPGGLVKMEGTDAKGKEISTTLRGEKCTIAGKKVDCMVLSLPFGEGGEIGEFWLSASVPGELVKIVQPTDEGKETVMFEVTDFEVR